MKPYKKRLAELKRVTEIQCTDGNWNYDPYMQGMANGLLLALHLITGAEGTPQYKNAPKEWLFDKGMPKGKPTLVDFRNPEQA